jgi:glycogen operon protein
MLVAGDEMGRTQGGNNNAYCQDTELSWLDWDLGQEDRELLEFTRRMIRLNKSHHVFRRRHFFQGRRIKGTDIKDITWLNPEGTEMTDEQWQHASARCLGLWLVGDALEEEDERGGLIVDDSFLQLLNASSEDIKFTLPGKPGVVWQVIVDTAWPAHVPGDAYYYQSEEQYPLQARSLVLLIQRAHPPQ